MLIIADDLSGAADCGVACAKAGLDTIVSLDEAAGTGNGQAVAIDADTRGKPAAAAAAETARIVRAHAAPGQILFKKLDSTLRGNVGAELAAVLLTRRAMHGNLIAIMAPAFPATGRTTACGHQLLHGVPLEHTDIWRREGIEGIAYIPAMLDAWGLRTAVIRLEIVRDEVQLRTALAEAAAHCDVIVCDASVDADLRAIARASMLLGRNTIWVGSAGLAHYLPEATGLQRRRRALPLPIVNGPMLFTVGSVSAISREQVRHLAPAGVEVVTVPPALLRAGAGTAGWAGSQAALAAALATGHDTVALLGMAADVDLSEGPQLCQALGQLVAPFVWSVSALVATGGETARAVLQGSGVTGLRLIGELEAGVPVSITTDGHALPVITKAGAFGQPDTLLHCRAALRSPAGTFNQQEIRSPCHVRPSPSPWATPPALDRKSS